MTKQKASPLNAYFASFPKETRTRLETLRRTIATLAPEAEETIRYGMPTFRLHDTNLVHFAAFKQHIGFYPLPATIERFKPKLVPFMYSKGAIQFPLDRPLPLTLVKALVRFRIQEVVAPKTTATAKGKTPAPRSPRRPRHSMPDFIKDALLKTKLMERYQLRPPYQQNDYIGWITRGIQATTRQKRLAQMLDELKKGNVYMKMRWHAKH